MEIMPNEADFSRKIHANTVTRNFYLGNLGYDACTTPSLTFSLSLPVVCVYRSYIYHGDRWNKSAEIFRVPICRYTILSPLLSRKRKIDEHAFKCVIVYMALPFFYAK